MPAHLDLAVLVTLNVVAVSLGENPTLTKNSVTNNDISLLESKDVLLQMLEKKLKEIKEHQKRKSDSKNGNGDILPKNVDLKLKSNGISAVGESELLLRYGKTGQGTVNLNSDGISNVGKVQLTVETGDNGIQLPGLNNLFVGTVFKSDDKNDQDKLQQLNVIGLNSGFRRQSNISNVTDTVDKAEAAVQVDGAKIDEETINATTATISSSVDLVSDPNSVNLNVANANVAAASSSIAEIVAANTTPVVASNVALKMDPTPVNAMSSNAQNVNAV